MSEATHQASLRTAARGVESTGFHVTPGTLQDHGTEPDPELMIEGPYSEAFGLTDSRQLSG